MKNFLFFAGVLTLGAFISCASRPAISAPPSTPPETPPLREPVIGTAMEAAIRRVKENSPLLNKFFVIEETGDIIVKAHLAEIQHDTGELEHFEVIYDENFRNSKLLFMEESNSVYAVPFMLVSLNTAAVVQDTLLWRPRKDASGILLAFDDDYKEVWEDNFDLLDRYDAKVTFFVQGKYCSFSSTALERGHDVGYHSLNHLNLTKVSREVFFEETISQTEIFRSNGVPLLSFAYPFGLSESWMHDELLKTYRILRGYGVTYRVYDSMLIREAYISSKALDTILFKEDEDFKSMIDVMLKTVKFIGGDLVLPLTSHTISDSASWGIKPHRLEYLLQTAKNLQLNFYRYRDFAD